MHTAAFHPEYHGRAPRPYGWMPRSTAEPAIWQGDSDARLRPEAAQYLSHKSIPFGKPMDLR